MSLELPRLPSMPPTHQQLQIWWQQVTEAIEAQEATQDAILANLQTQGTTLTDAQAAMAVQTQILAQTIANLTGTQNALDATQGDVDAVSGTVGTLDSRVTTLEASAPYVRQDATPAWSMIAGAVQRGGGTVPASYTVSNPPTQAEVTSIANDLVATLKILNAVVTDLAGNGALTG